MPDHIGQLCENDVKTNILKKKLNQKCKFALETIHIKSVYKKIKIKLKLNQTKTLQN